jgi:hypothetical protein
LLVAAIALELRSRRSRAASSSEVDAGLRPRV